ncbi:MAG: lipoyl synthase [Candidatus Omnitrophota bacterium]
MNRLPPWFAQQIPDQAVLGRIDEAGGARVRTVCREARCPNTARCLKNKQLTFLILGPVCTRHCLFCAVQKAYPAQAADPQESGRIAALVKRWDLRYVVVTSVTRDDLPDGGSGLFCGVVDAIRGLGGDRKIELLVPDFQGKVRRVEEVVAAGPDVFGHNIETVARLYPDVRPEADYSRSLEILKAAKSFDPGIITKSSIMLGLGENEYDVYSAMEHLRRASVDILTLGQYLAPSDKHYAVREFIAPERFARYGDIARQLGFRAVLSGPLVRSSFRAEELYNSILCSI